MRIDTRYACETCGMSYRSRDLALACEATVLPPCPVAAGDAVRVRERYDAPQPDVVKSVRVGSSPSGHMAAELPDGHGTVVRMAAPGWPGRLHVWLVEVGSSHQVGKDADAFSDVFPLEDVMVGDRFLGDPS